MDEGMDEGMGGVVLISFEWTRAKLAVVGSA